MQRQIRRFLRLLYQKPVHLSISSTVLFEKVKNVRGRFAPHESTPPEIRRLKRFATQNLGAGGIYFRRASQITEGRSTPQGCGVQKKTRPTVVSFFGGPDRIRTDDPHNANVMRSQLRYWPIAPPIGGTSLL